MTLKMTPLIPPPILHLSGLITPYVPPATFSIVPSSHSFYQDFKFWDGRATMVMFVSAAPVSSFFPFTQLHISHSIIGRTSRFTSLSFGSTHDFTIMCNSHEIFPSPQKIGPTIEGITTTIVTYVAVFKCPAQCQVKKHFPYGWDCRRIWTLCLSHIPSYLECLPSSTWTGRPRVWSTPRHFQIPFFQLHPICFIVPILFPVKICQGMHNRGAVVSNLTDQG